MVGDSLLVAPLFAGEAERQVVLPAGDWFDFETGERFEGARRITVSPGLDVMPVFVREGAIIPLMPPLSHAPRAGDAVPLEVRHYGPAPGAFLLYDDDGETCDYEAGQCRWRNLEVRITPEGERHGAIMDTDADWPSTYGEVIWRFYG
jgi:alpha-glucosidase (family GH31 glycosyl hydrolase)